MSEKSELKLPHVVKLNSPLKVTDSISRTEIVFKNELRVEHLYDLSIAEMLNFATVPMGKLEPALCAMTGEPPAVIQALHPIEASQCVEVLFAFFVSGRTSG
jgi:hypothetical protein